MAVIEDGTGTRYGAKVDKDNNLHVFTHQRDLRTISEEEETSFQMYAKRNFAAGGTDEFIAYFEYDGAGSCHIEQMVFSTDSAGGKVEVHMDPTSVSGATAANVLNLNRSSQVASETITLSGATTITATVDSPNEVLDERCSIQSGSILYPWHSALILRKGDSFSVKGSVTNTGEKIRFNMLWFEETE